MTIIENTTINGESCKVVITDVATMAEAIDTIRALAILAAAEIANQSLSVIQKHHLEVTECHAVIKYPCGDSLEYIIMDESGAPIGTM